MAKTDTRVARSCTFTFESIEEKAAMHALAKRQGRTLAGLIKYLLAADLATHPAPPAAPAGGKG